MPVLAVCSLGVVACGTPHVGAAPGSSPRPSHSPLLLGCGPVPPRHAWATKVSADGHVRWQVRLPTIGANSDTAQSPVVAAGIALFAQDGVVHGLRLADGQQRWSWAGGQTVYGMWPWHGTVAVLTDQVSTHARLTGLDAVTGRVVWTVRLPRQGLYGTLAATTDGGLAMIGADGRVRVAGLGTGRVRWAQPASQSPGPAAIDGNVVTGAGGRLTGYDDRSGRVRWRLSGVPSDPVLQALAGLVLVTSGSQGPHDPTALTAVSPATGRVAWRFDPGTPVTVLSADRAGLAVTTYANRRLYLIDPASGRVRWHAATFIAQDTVPLVTATDVYSMEGGAVDYPVQRIADRNAANGKLRWARALAAQAIGPQPVLRIGTQVVAQTNSGKPDGKAPLLAFHAGSGQPAWRVDLPTLVQAPPVLVPGGLLVQADDPGYACPAAGAAIPAA
ncbi:MAG TPA: PQQ-binding-like beta-propeller repeat protein [Streptosporangiaceae bacterium]|jgi:outer membrane protein assembly factor BamB|nr:PQQ-binding-like beta-propeller repeat protein [Streptosporangiaceae bacterium]